MLKSLREKASNDKAMNMHMNINMRQANGAGGKTMDMGHERNVITSRRSGPVGGRGAGDRDRDRDRERERERERERDRDRDREHIKHSREPSGGGGGSNKIQAAAE